MDKRRAIQIMTKAAELYRDNLEDQKVLFLYGLPLAVKQQLQTKGKLLSAIQSYEVAFHRYNFLHLTGVKLNRDATASAIHFYQKCLDKRLTEKDIRDVTAQPTYKIFAVISKNYTDDKYSQLAKLDKSINLSECYFSEEIENLIERDRLIASQLA